MQPLEKSLRTKLENTVKAAREVAEKGAIAALQQLGVSQAVADQHLSDSEKSLRRKLRAHGRQLGDIRGSKGEQQLTLLAEEIAYEHWHRMLFARFLAENDLLMYPDPDEPVAVSLEECEEMAPDEGARNGWELAARYAAHMLPQIFRNDSPSFKLDLPPEFQKQLEDLLSKLSDEVFIASDALGWVYQFWQSKRKDEVNSSEVKIGARELPAVTQLFTEDYMVSFLLDNSLGAWWANKRLSEEDLRTAKSEDELRLKAALPGVPLSYLRFIKNEGSGSWTPAAGTFDQWPESLAELKTLDPCCGSGHFLVAAFLMLVPMRMELEGLPTRDAVDLVIKENLHGLELDSRCVEIAAFAVALTAWKFPDAGGYRKLPELQIACSGLSVSVAKEEWKQLPFERQDMRIAMDWLYDTFEHAPVLGSLIDPAKSKAAKLVEWDKLQSALTTALENERGEEKEELGITARGLAKAAQLLSQKYTWVITNVPYRKRGDHCEKLKEFCEKKFPKAKNDLATVFLDRCLDLCQSGGATNLVLPQNWLFLKSYSTFRKKLLEKYTWNLVARLGEGGFDSSAAAGAFVAMISISNNKLPNAELPLLSQNESTSREIITGIDVSSQKTPNEKSSELKCAPIKTAIQNDLLSIPDERIAFEVVEGTALGNCVKVFQGIMPSDRGQLNRMFFEMMNIGNGWEFMQSSSINTAIYGGMSGVFNFGKFELIYKTIGGRMQGMKAWNNKGISVSQMRSLPSNSYSGALFDGNVDVIIPNSIADIPAIWMFFESGKFSEGIRKLEQKLDINTGTIAKVPFDLEHWSKIALGRYPQGLPKPYSDDPTQWIFHGHPFESDIPLQVAVARLLGYQWPAELDEEMELSDEAREKINLSKQLLHHADEDGIVCIPAVRTEASAADRLKDLLVDAYGDDWDGDELARLLRGADHDGKTLETWLRDKFFIQHCKLFQHRPFIWQIWDGLPDGFSVVINYHKFDAKSLETLTYNYLGDWISRQKDDLDNGVDGAAEKLAAAELLQKRLIQIAKGEAPYDIFVRWKAPEDQPIGWNPDLNDGVRLNIRPFMTAPDIKKRGAGILRDKPNIKWGKDRGKDVETAPWYHLGPQYGGKEGDRINDHHLTLEEKQKAREEVE